MKWIGIVSLIFTACLSPSPPDGELGCEPATKACPTGYYCASDNSCYKNGSLGPDLAVAGPDGGTDDGGDTDGGPATGAIAIAPMTKDFGTIVSGTKSAAGRFTITNGAVPTGSLMIALTGPQAADFVTQSDNCTSVSLVAHGSCTVDVVFQPRLTTTGSATAMLTISGSPGGSATAQLSGNAVAPGALTLTPTSNDFMKVELNKVSTEVTFTVKNTGGAATGTVTAALSGSDMDQFTLGNDCSGTLASNATCTLRVTFAPKSGGMKTASLTASATPGGNAAAALTGTATLANGTATTMASQCTSGIVSGGVCCDTACTGSCTSCTLAATKGTCSPQPTSVQCNTTCKDAMTQTDFFCNGAGACSTTGTDIPCTSFACGAGQCKTACTTSADCQTSAGYACSNSKCVKPESDCLDGIDNNGDGLTDCADPSCTTVSCVPAPAGGSEVGTLTATCPTDYGTPVVYNKDLVVPPCTGCGCTGTIDCKLDVYLDTVGTDCSHAVFKSSLSTVTPAVGGETQASVIRCASLATLSGVKSASIRNPVVNTTSCTPSGSASRGTPTWSTSTNFCSSSRRSNSCAAGQICVAKPAATNLCLRIPSEGASCPAGWNTGSVANYYTSFTDSRTCNACQCSVTGATCRGAGTTIDFLTSAASCPAPPVLSSLSGYTAALGTNDGGDPCVATGSFASPMNSFAFSYDGAEATCSGTSSTAGTAVGQGASTMCCR